MEAPSRHHVARPPPGVFVRAPWHRLRRNPGTSAIPPAAPASLWSVPGPARAPGPTLARGRCRPTPMAAALSPGRARSGIGSRRDGSGSPWSPSFMHAGGLPPRSDYAARPLSSHVIGLHRFFIETTGDPSGGPWPARPPTQPGRPRLEEPWSRAAPGRADGTDRPATSPRPPRRASSTRRPSYRCCWPAERPRRPVGPTTACSPWSHRSPKTRCGSFPVLMAEDCVAFADAASAGLLYDALLPYAERFAVATGAVACTDSVHRPLAGLATLLGRHDASRANTWRRKAGAHWEDRDRPPGTISLERDGGQRAITDSAARLRSARVRARPLGRECSARAVARVLRAHLQCPPEV